MNGEQDPIMRTDPVMIKRSGMNEREFSELDVPGVDFKDDVGSGKDSVGFSASIADSPRTSSFVGVAFGVTVGLEVGMVVGARVAVGPPVGGGVADGALVGEGVDVGCGVGVAVGGIGVGVGVGAKSAQSMEDFVGS